MQHALEMRRYPLSCLLQIAALLSSLAVHTRQPSQVYILNACNAGEKLQAALRVEAFRSLLAQRVEFFDRHSSSQLTQLLSRDLDSIRAFVFANTARDRGLRALLEALGTVGVLFALRWEGQLLGCSAAGCCMRSLHWCRCPPQTPPLHPGPWPCLPPTQPPSHPPAGCSWRLGPILAGVIVASVCTAFLYRRQTRSLEATNAAAQQRLAEVASSSFTNMRTVRIFAGEALEQQRFGQQVARSYASGLGFAKAKAMLEGGRAGR
jgi:ATP-binding cassette subfamily B (MDR/TAP) protein 8